MPRCVHQVAMFDPLDGSSNVDAGLATGTIFGILRRPAHLTGPVRTASPDRHRR